MGRTPIAAPAPDGHLPMGVAARRCDTQQENRLRFAAILR